jgi:hypothetical protein
MSDWRDDRVGAARRGENPTVLARLRTGFAVIGDKILGNSWPVLHAHVHARYSWEPAEYRRGPVWRYPAEVRFAEEYALAAAHDCLRRALTAALDRIATHDRSADAGALA